MIRYILVVDTSKLVRKIIIDSLEDFGCTVVGEAGSGEEALTQYKLLKPDLVIMNLVLPNISGVEIIEKILNIDPASRIIICSSCQERQTIYHAIKTGAKDFMLKPFNIEKFKEIAAKLV